MLAGLRLVGAKLDGLPERGFRFLQHVRAFEHPPGMLQHHQAMRAALGRDLGCQIGQGYFIASPMDGTRMPGWAEALNSDQPSNGA